MKNLLINLLFRLLGNTTYRLYSIQYLFGTSTFNHETRKRNWEKALIRLYRDKDLLDFLYYQSESDKENVFKGKINSDLAKGARIRTLFLIYSARRAYELSWKQKRSGVKKEESDENLKELSKVYKGLTSVDKD